MKRLGVPVFGVIASIVFSFTLHSEGPNCEDYLYWFKVKNSVEKYCSLINVQDFIDIPDANNDGSPNEVVQSFASGNPYGCQDLQTYACALGYNLSQIIRVPVGATFVWRPISTQVTSYKCCVTRPNIK